MTCKKIKTAFKQLLTKQSLLQGTEESLNLFYPFSFKYYFCVYMYMNMKVHLYLNDFSYYKGKNQKPNVNRWGFF